MYVKHTGQSREKIERTLDRDHFMTAEESQSFGLIDSVIDKRPVDETAAKT
jgi:ATP-dependent Clp protease protease subunit